MKRNGAQPEPKPKTINCQQCGAVLNVKRDLRRRAVRGHKDITEMGLQCWKCSQWVHIYFSGPELDKRRTAYRKAQRRAISTQKPKDVEKMQALGEAYREAYDRLNGELREELGIVDRLYVTSERDE